MTRKKVKLAFINNDLTRKATYRKRKMGLMKKVSELSTLCGIDVAAIIYSPYESQAVVWPLPSEVNRIVSTFKKMPETRKNKKMENQESFLKQRVANVKEHLEKRQKENREAELAKLMFDSLTREVLDDLSMIDLNDLGLVIDDNRKEIIKKMDSLTTTSTSPSTDVRSDAEN